MSSPEDRSFEERAQDAAKRIVNEVIPFISSLRAHLSLLNDTSIKAACDNFDRPKPKGELRHVDIVLRGRSFIRVLFDEEGNVSLEYHAFSEARDGSSGATKKLKLIDRLSEAFKREPDGMRSQKAVIANSKPLNPNENQTLKKNTLLH